MKSMIKGLRIWRDFLLRGAIRRNKSQEDLVYNKKKNTFSEKKKKMDRIPIILNYHPALLDLQSAQDVQSLVDISSILKEILLKVSKISCCGAQVWRAPSPFLISNICQTQNNVSFAR